ncbi:extracellular solute-binding protein [Cohnella sp. CFH 77786]|uniref:extracellular solute-binding protein n=1 Tax=Cohnella sp. CFH 77786 TaxID=2662265 RepID=UPI001C610734|nr:extracellular solute-binding protein [Cohnella sp. CFH 77786]MBW5445782.1 extracellular solute-binding protein [Cohnella sp. CFH 77786]
MRSKRMIMVKRMFAFSIPIIAAFLLFMPAQGPGNVRAVSAMMPEDNQGYVEESYRQYLADQGYAGTMASSEIKVDLGSYRTSGDMQARMDNGSVIIGDSGTLTWNVSVQEAGFYNIAVKYLPVKGTNSKIERKLTIDGQSLFKGMDQLIFNRIWDNSGGKPIAEKDGNEIRPEAVEKPEWKTVYLNDSQKRSLEPYKFYLSAGKHTLTLESVKEPLEIGDITLKAAPEIKPYAEVIQEWKKEYKVYDKANLVYQAERTDRNTLNIEKSSVDIVMSTDYSNPNTVPYHPYKIKLNTIGGPNWRTPGDYIQWRMNVPEEGLYSLSFRGEQNTNRGVMSYRQLKVNGEVPFLEAAAIPFGFHTGFVNYVLGKPGEDYLIPLKQGENTISLEVVLGRFAMPLSEVEQSVLVLNELYRKTVQITGLAPDKYIDYEITKKIPDYAETFRAESDRLKKVVDELVRITGEKGEKTAIIGKMQVQAEQLSRKPESVIYELHTLENNISSMGSWISSISEMPLLLDSFALSAPGAELPSPKPNVFVRGYNSTVRFLSTFFVDQTQLSDASSGKALKVWFSAGRDQAQIIKNLIDQSFTPESNIAVDLQLIPEDVILPATLAGNGPDVALAIPQATVVNFAMRNALVDLSKLDGFNEIGAKFADSALKTVTYQNGIYGLPEQQTFMMMFYREDILEQLGLEPPKTWDDLENVISVLHAHQYDFYVNAQGLYPSLVYQYGGDLYQGSGNDYGIRSGLTDESAMNAFKRLTSFFTSYRLPVSADFPNRFRSSEMPIGIAPYTTFNQLAVFAPEIRGLWSFAPLPGVKNPDGSINRSAVSETVDSIMMSSSKKQKEAWEFLKWWMDTDTQTRYANALEAVMGAAARYPTANLEVLKQLPWSTQDSQELMKQFQETVGMPEVPGGYMTARAIDYAFRAVVTWDGVTSGVNPREALFMHVKQIDKELAKKRKEFHLSSIQNEGKEEYR